MAGRGSAKDFARDVSAQSKPGKNQYSASSSPDGTQVILKNGVVLHPRVFYAGSGGAATDANPTADKITIWFQDGSVATGDVTAFLATLV
jgi:hypothetical protein